MKARTAGFSLIEVVTSLAVFAVTAVTLIGILGTGITLSKGALEDAETSMILENIQARLTLDAGWPGNREAIYYDNSGAQLSSEDHALFRVVLEPVAGPGFVSDYFECYRVKVEHLPHRQKTGVWMLQRARLSGGKPQRVTP
jgi:prepilin-type N-terminal cleavage/methylation domain-containing protein